MDFDFSIVGGTSIPLVGNTGPESEYTAWDFGCQMQPPKNRPRKSLHSSVPKVKGAWDGKSYISAFKAVQEVTGSEMKAQRQTSGTCGGRGGSAALNCLQCVQIASGKRTDEYKPVSHAWVYAGAREHGGILGGGDGVIGPDVPKWCQKHGVIHQEESEVDTDYSSDRIADQWGRRGIPRKYRPLATDNLIEEMQPVFTAEEAADVIASGGVVMVASDQGFSMTRDREGICSPRGMWMHFMFFGSVGVTQSGRAALGCGQSWGENVPDGPRFFEDPSFVFGVDFRTATRMLSQRQSFGVTGFAGWQAEAFDLSWMFG